MRQPRAARRRIVCGAVAACLWLSCKTSGIDLAYQSEGRIAASVDATVHAFEAYDHDHELAIVKRDADAGHPERASDDLKAYRARRAVVNKALADFQALLLLGKTLLPLVEQQQKAPTEVSAWLQNLFTAAQAVADAVRAIEGS